MVDSQHFRTLGSSRKSFNFQNDCACQVECCIFINTLLHNWLFFFCTWELNDDYSLMIVKILISVANMSKSSNYFVYSQHFRIVVLETSKTIVSAKLNAAFSLNLSKECCLSHNSQMSRCKNEYPLTPHHFWRHSKHNSTIILRILHGNIDLWVMVSVVESALKIANTKSIQLIFWLYKNKP